jgi:hypothetical protein
MGMPNINRGNESAGAIARNFGATRVSGGNGGGAGAVGAAHAVDGCADIQRCAAQAGKSAAAPDYAPHRGETTPGLVETLINGTMGAGSLGPAAGTGGARLPVGDMKRG